MYKIKAREKFFKELIINANLYPNKIAVVDDKSDITYESLLCIVSSIASQIIKKYKSDSVIVVEANKNIESIIAILSVCMAGKIFIPVSNLMPKSRIKEVIDDSNGAYLPNSSINLKNNYKKNEIINLEDNNDNFYVIYTSGTTGRPKGVLMEYEGAFNTIDQIISMNQINKYDVFLNVASLDFDLSIFDIFASIKVGGKLILVENPQDIKKVSEIIEKEKVTIWNSVPTMIEMLVLYSSFNKKINLETLRLLLLSGDKTKIETAKLIKEKCKRAKIVSLGGATECGIWSTYFEFDPIKKYNKLNFIPYGEALPNQEILLLNDEEKQVEVGKIGELYILGQSLAKGYINDEKKTSEAFVKLNNFSGKRAYKTGDLLYRDEYGFLIFSGRKDRQVKVNGYRVELDGIENKTSEFLGVDTAVISIDNRIILFVEAKYEKIETEIFKTILPKYMIPSEIMFINKMPLTKNEKKDYKKLRSMYESQGGK